MNGPRVSVSYVRTFYCLFYLIASIDTFATDSKGNQVSNATEGKTHQKRFLDLQSAHRGDPQSHRHHAFFECKGGVFGVPDERVTLHSKSRSTAALDGMVWTLAGGARWGLEGKCATHADSDRCCRQRALSVPTISHHVVPSTSQALEASRVSLFGFKSQAASSLTESTRLLESDGLNYSF